MIHKTWLVIWITALTLSTEPLNAAGNKVHDQTSTDLHCLAVGSILSTNSDQHFQSAGTIMTVYYLGRLDGEAPNKDLQKGLKEESLRMTPQDFEKSQVSCRALMVERAKLLSAISSSMAN